MKYWIRFHTENNRKGILQFRVKGSSIYGCFLPLNWENIKDENNPGPNARSTSDIDLLTSLPKCPLTRFNFSYIFAAKIGQSFKL